MPEYDPNEYFSTSIDGVRKVVDTDTVIGKPITTPSGVTVIPVSKVTMGFLTGGVDYGTKKLSSTGTSGGGGGTGLSITPLAFLTVSPDADIKLIPLEENASGLDKLLDVVEHAPDLIGKIKDILA